MTYEESLELLARLGNEVTTAKFGLENIRTLCAALGHPEKKYLSILIAGTNGKGSTAATIYSILLQAGLRTGCFISPHLVHPRERIRVQRDWISEKDFAVRISDVELVAQQLLKDGGLHTHPTYFETLTAAAYLHLAHCGVELAVLEVGMGGRLDATNISDPAVTLIVSLSLDHQQYLGRHIEAIAAEKAGILRENVPAIVGPLERAAANVVSARCREVGAPLLAMAEEASCTVTAVRDGFYELTIATRQGRYERLQPSLRGPQQCTNATLAVLTAEQLQRRGYPLSNEDIRQGIARTYWPGRMQVVRENPRLLLDGAHNLEAGGNLARFLEENFAQGDLVFIFGSMQDKDYAAMGRLLFPPARVVILTQSKNSRSASTETLLETFGAEFDAKLRLEPEVGKAIELATRLARPESWIVLAGSLYLVGEALEYLGIDPAKNEGSLGMRPEA